MIGLAEVFTSIQGEGPKVGTPSIFIRTIGCSLSCSFCFAGNEEVNIGPSLEDFKKIKEEDIKDILKEICISDEKMQLIVDKLKM